MTFRKTLSVGIVGLLTVSTTAQTQLPPVWEDGNHSYRTDELSQVYLAPTRIVWTSSDTAVVNAERLLTVSDGQAEMVRTGTCKMQTGKDTASIILDYGRELHGGLKLIMGPSGKRGGSAVRIRFGESVEETCSELLSAQNEKKYSTNDHAIRDMVVEIPREGKIEIGHTGFRFVRIDLLQANSNVHIKEASAVFRYRDIPYLGSFHCSDSLLNRIWMTGAYTVHLNMQEYLWDGIKRDRLVWLGDMHPEVATIQAVFGFNDIVDKSIDLACKQFPLPKWLNNMSSYSMWYLIIQYEWYMHNGNRAFIEKHRDYIKGVIDRIDACVAEDGTENLAEWRFLDWPSTPNKQGVEAGYRALLCWAMADAEKLCNLLNEKEYAARCERVSQRIEQIRMSPNGLKQAAALMTLAGQMDAKEACEDVILTGGAKGFSTFYGYYMLEALAQGNNYQQAIDIIRRFWGGMLRLGATTFWEDFNLDWTENAGRIDDFTPTGKKDIHGDYGDYCYPSYRHSLCHGWASGPTPWMTRHILGIEIMEPGCKRIRVTPHLGDLEWAEGTFPTPQGIIRVRHQKEKDGKITTTVDAPEGVTVVKE